MAAGSTPQYDDATIYAGIHASYAAMQEFATMSERIYLQGLSIEPSAAL